MNLKYLRERNVYFLKWIISNDKFNNIKWQITVAFSYCEYKKNKDTIFHFNIQKWFFLISMKIKIKEIFE